MDIALDEFDAKRAFVVYSGYDTSHVFRTTNGGAAWLDCDSGSLPNVPTNTVVIDPTLPNNVYIGNDIGVYISQDGGITWNEFSEGMPPAIVMDLSISKSNRMLRAFTHGLGVWERKLSDSTAPVSVREEKGIPLSFSLEQNYPNPFNPKTVIRYTLSRNSFVSLKVYDVIGKEITTLINENRPSGNHEITFDASPLSSGIYFYRLVLERNGILQFSETKKMVVVK